MRSEKRKAIIRINRVRQNFLLGTRRSIINNDENGRGQLSSGAGTAMIQNIKLNGFS